MLEDTAWPNFYVVGAQKCGTTSVYYHLRRHPQVFLPEEKEPAFFANFPTAREKMIFPASRTTIDEYRRFYQGARGFGAIGDASPHYLRDEESPRRIHEVSPQAKIIIMLRDPVVRAHSAYLMNLARHFDFSPSFCEALARDEPRPKADWFTAHHYVGAGLYYEQVHRYLNIFGREQVQVLLFEDLAAKPRQLLTSIAGHIGIDPAPFAAMDLSQPYNAYQVPRFRTVYRFASALGQRTKLLPPSVRAWLKETPLLHDRTKPPLDIESRRHLQSIFDPDITRLEELLGRKLPELRKSWV